MSKTKGQAKRESRKQAFVRWATRYRRVLIVAGALVPLAGVFALVLTERQRTIGIIALVSALLMLAFCVLMIAVARIIEQLKAIRSELVMIRARVDTGLFDDMAADLTALRSQMDKGLLGLLRM